MPHDRYYYSAPIEKGREITISGDEHKHLNKVMRAEVGDTVEVANGLGTVAEAKILEIGKNSATLRVRTVNEFAKTQELNLYLAYIKQSLLEWVVEKVTELGVTKIVLFPTEKSLRSNLSENHTRRLNVLLISALKQSGRAHLPIIEILNEFPKFPKSSCYGSFSESTSHLLTESLSREVSSFIVGPESGFTEKEERLLDQMGVEAVTLGDNILRAETAAVTAIAVLASSNAYKSVKEH